MIRLLGITDKTFGFVVRAESEEQAREIAEGNSADESVMRNFVFNDGKLANKMEVIKLKTWMNPKYSTCIELTADGDAGLVMEDFAAA